MDKIEILIKSIENNKVKIDFFRKREENKNFYYVLDIEKYDVKYKIKENVYSFIYMFGKESIDISYSPEENETLQRRIDFSYIINEIKEKLKTSSMFKLKFLLNQIKLSVSPWESVILDLDNFEKRQTETFIKEKREEIVQKIEKNMRFSVSNHKSDYLFLVIKEKDEVPLMHFLIKEGYMKEVVSYNQRHYLKITKKENFDSETFFENWITDMKELGYNLLFVDEIDNTDYYYDDVYDWDYRLYEEDEYEEYYKK